MAAAALWLRLHFGPLTSDIVMGIVLLVVGGIIAMALIVARDRRPATQASLTGRILENFSGADLQGLALIFENRPVLASALALMLGLEKGMRKNGRQAR